MIHKITTPHILTIFFLLSLTVNAQSSSPPAVSPTTLPPYTWDVSISPVILALICSFIFVCSFVIYLRHCSDLDSNATENQISVANNCSSNNCPQGIDTKLLNTFPILMYSSVKHLNFGKATASECAVCLREFKHCEKVRSLPRCNHIFHPQCIDAWLASHMTCPICRLRPVEEKRLGENDSVIVISMN